MTELSKRAKRKKRRRIEAESYAKDARFWRNQKSADRLGYNRPVDKQASKDLK